MRFEELSAEIMQLLQAEINALEELDFGMRPDCANALKHESTFIN